MRTQIDELLGADSFTRLKKNDVQFEHDQTCRTLHNICTTPLICHD